MKWRGLGNRTATGGSPRPAPARCVLVEEAPGPSTDYLLKPWLAQWRLPIERFDGRRPPSPEVLRPGDLVVLSRYVPAAWRRLISRRLPTLAGLAYFMDDDLLDTAAHVGLERGYARKLAALASTQRRWLVAHADAFWVSTPVLAEKYAALSPVWVPLAPGPALLARRTALRIAYHGTASHGAEIEWLHPVLAAVQAQCPHTHVELFGELPVQRRFRDLPRVSVLHPMRWENYLAYTATHAADLGLAPLLPLPFNAARGAVKFYDYARMGAVGLYSDLPTYRGLVRHGVDGLLLPDDPAAWIEALVRLAQPASDELAHLRAGLRQRLDAGG